MSEYDELVKGARAWKVSPFDDYAEKVALVGLLCDAIERLASERDYFRDAFKDCANREAVILQREAERAKVSQSEVERLKGVLGDIKRNADCGGDAGLFRWQTLSEITKALEAKP